MVEKPNTLQKTSITVLLVAVITLAAIPTLLNPVQALDSYVRTDPRVSGGISCDPDGSGPIPPGSKFSSNLLFNAEGTSGTVVSGTWGEGTFFGSFGPITGGSINA